MACMAVCTWNTTLKGNTFKSTSLGSSLKYKGVLKPPVCSPTPLQALGKIFVPQDKKKPVSCFGRTLVSHSSENCSAVQTSKCNCILIVDGLIHALYRCFIQGINAMCPPGICFYLFGLKRYLQEMLVMAPDIALLLFNPARNLVHF